MATISLRIDESELEVFKNYAKHHNMTLSEIIRLTMINRIEEEYDMNVFREYENDKANGTLNVKPIEKLWEELEL